MPDKIDLGVLGTTGLKQYDGVIDEEWSKKLRGSYGAKVYREMSDSSSAIGAILFAIESLVRQVEWRVEPAEPTPEGEKWAQFLEECILDLNATFEDFMAEVLSCLTYGWSYFEILYKLRKGMTGNKDTQSRFNDGKIGWRGFSIRSQDTLDRWQFSDENDLEGLHQWDQITGHKAFIPIEKSLLFRPKATKGNPEGRSLFRNAVVDYFFYKRICKIEAIGIERDMTGLLVMEVPTAILSPSASAENKALLASLQQMLGELKRDEREYAVVPTELNKEGKPTGFKMKLLSTGGKRQIDTTQVKQSYKIGMLQSVLAQFLELGMNSVGSFALASSQTNLFAVALGAILDTITATFNKHGSDKLMQLNGVDPELWPSLVHGDLEDMPLAELGAYIQALASSGQLPDDEAIQRKLLEIAKLPMPQKEEGAGVQKHRHIKGFKKQYVKDK